MDRWMDVSPVVVHTEYHILLFSFGPLLLPVVGLNKMGPKEERRGSLHQSCALFPGSTLFARNVTVAKSSRATAMKNRQSRWRMEVCVCVCVCGNQRWCKCREHIDVHLVTFTREMLLKIFERRKSERRRAAEQEVKEVGCGF